MADEKAKPIRDLGNFEDMDDLTHRKHSLRSMTRSMTQSLSPTDAAAVLSTGKEGGIAGCSDLARASQRADAYNRYAADLLRLIDQLPPGHPECEAARAKLRTMRPRALQAMDEVRSLQIRYALQLRDTPTGGMGRA